MPVKMDSISFHACLRPKKIAIRELSTKRTWTYLEADETISRTVSVLQARGVTSGDRVVFLAKNCSEFIFIHFACTRLGAIFVPLNWRLAKPELEHLIKDADPIVVIGDECLEEAGLDGISVESWREEIDHAPLSVKMGYDPALPSLILYTSGTTGLPKGALLSEDNIAATASNFLVLGQVSIFSVFLCDAPMFHIIGLVTNIQPALYVGGEVLISNGFKPKQTLARLSDPNLAVSHYFCVPQMAVSIRRLPEYKAEDLKGLVGIFTGGGPHSAAHINAWLDYGISAVDGYGMSEVGTICGMPIDPDIIRTHAGAVGIVPRGVQLLIADLAGNEVPFGNSGEILVKGANVFSNYWRQDLATQAAFNEDGWFKTGDIGRLDEDGFLWLLGRSKDMYISGGENVYPAEIEAVLAGHPLISECAVVQQKDEKWGEVGHLFVVLNLEANLTEDMILSELNMRLARYKIPKYVSYIDQLPRNAAGKVRKEDLRKLLRGIEID